MPTLAYINNEVKPYQEVSLHVSDVSIQRGYAIFDFMAHYKEKVPFIDKYVARFYTSAELMFLDIPITKKEIKQIIYELISKNNFETAGIKLLLTGGYSNDGYTPSTPNLIILNNPFPLTDKEFYSAGTGLVTCAYRRSIPEAKTIDYAVSIRHFQRVKMTGITDVLYVWDENILEASRCNFFLVKKGTVITPGKNVLFGITRGEVLAITRNNYPVEERDIHISELATADEAFITSTTKCVLPIVKIDDIIIGKGKVGPITDHVKNLFIKLLL